MGYNSVLFSHFQWSAPARVAIKIALSLSKRQTAIMTDDGQRPNPDMTQKVDTLIAAWKDTGGSELSNTQSFINGLCDLIGVPAPDGAMADEARNDYAFERGVHQDNGDDTTSFGRIDCYRRGAFILEAKQGSNADRKAADAGKDDLDIFGQTAARRLKRGTARRGTGGWTAAMLAAKGQAERYSRALPIDHEWPPFLIVTDVGYCLDI